MDARTDLSPFPFPSQPTPHEQIRQRSSHAVQRLIALMLGSLFLVLVARAFRSDPAASSTATQGATKLVQRAADALAARARARAPLGILRTPTLTIRAFSGDPGPTFDVFGPDEAPLDAGLTLEQLRQRYPSLAIEPITASNPDGTPMTQSTGFLPPADAPDPTQ